MTISVLENKPERMMMWSSKMRQQCWHHAAYTEVSPELYQSTSLLPGRFVENGFFGRGRSPYVRRTKQHRYDCDQLSHPATIRPIQLTLRPTNNAINASSLAPFSRRICGRISGVATAKNVPAEIAIAAQ